jgi:hypothetical protein
MTAITIPKDRLARLETLTLEQGKHDPNGTFCVMEAVAWIANERWSDAPECVSPVIAAFARNWNDSLNVEDRNRLLKPLVVEMIGTRTTPEDEETRAWMATDWLARVHTPAWLRLAGLTKHAEALEGCARIVDAVTAGLAQPRLEEARQASAAAWDAAWDAARAAASAAAREAAWDAASAAARAAASAALLPTVAALQESAVELVRAMCAVGRVEVVVTAEGTP